ncbi:MAG: type II toxin-antitoxin system mRNA interferase toxin, RelE/StbE family [Nitrospirales bacterium]|nr:type II toxin-antitoxin system mRNA interferase toxin, RelE/StbE family [Nitrospirales bacterium]
MSWYRVAYLPPVIDDLRATDKGIAQRLFDKTKWLASNAENLRHEPLDQDLPGLAQYAVGDWLILYTIDREEHVVDIHRIGTRGDLYRSHSTQKNMSWPE